MAIEVASAADDFSDWHELLRLLQGAFAFMDERIDPPSSVHRLTAISIAAKAKQEVLFLALDGRALVGCVFARQQEDSLYVGKLAVEKDRRGHGTGRRLMEAAEGYARDIGLAELELETRIELIENHETFAALGYSKVAEHAHAGYDRSTYVTMRKKVKGVGSRLRSA